MKKLQPWVLPIALSSVFVFSPNRWFGWVALSLMPFITPARRPGRRSDRKKNQQEDDGSPR